LRHFSSTGIDIAYRDLGEGDPILLIHGFASNSAVNWVLTSWIETLRRDGRRVIAMDVRGHGESAKLYDPAAYRPGLLAADAANLIDHLSIGRADVMGYSMGARIATNLALDHPERVRSLVLGGMGLSLVEGRGDEDEIAQALEAESGEAVASEVGRGYRAFAERTGSDLHALAACMRGQRETIPAERLATIAVPVLVAVGTNDHVVGSASGLARLIAGAEVLDIVGRDHMLASGDRQFKAGVTDFLKRRP
jgi:pimeloyl-ACP methyl ester carboxylesterase